MRLFLCVLTPWRVVVVDYGWSGEAQLLLSYGLWENSLWIWPPPGAGCEALVAPDKLIRPLLLTKVRGSRVRRKSDSFALNIRGRWRNRRWGFRISEWRPAVVELAWNGHAHICRPATANVRLIKFSLSLPPLLLVIVVWRFSLVCEVQFCTAARTSTSRRQ